MELTQWQLTRCQISQTYSGQKGMRGEHDSLDSVSLLKEKLHDFFPVIYRIEKGHGDETLPSSNIKFESHIVTSETDFFRRMNLELQAFKDEKRGPAMVIVQANAGNILTSLLVSTGFYSIQLKIICALSPFSELGALAGSMSSLQEFPCVPLHISQDDDLGLFQLDWQRQVSRSFLQAFLRLPRRLAALLEHSRYLHVPVGNLPGDLAIFGSDLFYARHLQRHNAILWVSPTEVPDLGGREDEDLRFFFTHPLYSGVGKII